MSDRDLWIIGYPFITALNKNSKCICILDIYILDKIVMKTGEIVDYHFNPNGVCLIDSGRFTNIDRDTLHKHIKDISDFRENQINKILNE